MTENINFAVVVVPLHTEDYEAGMKKLTDLQADGFRVAQRNLIILSEPNAPYQQIPYCVYWLERGTTNEPEMEKRVTYLYPSAAEYRSELDKLFAESEGRSTSVAHIDGQLSGT